MSQRQSGGLESAAIRRAWVSGDPAGIESEAGRRALSQRRSGGVISRERRAPRGAATREPAGGLGRATAGGGYLPRSAGMRASRPLDSRRSRRTPTPSCSGLWRDYERRLPCRGTDRKLCCHLVSASAAWWQKLRDLGGVSSPRPSDSLTQTQPLNIIMTSLINHSQSVRYSHSLLSTSYWQCHLHTSLSVFWYLIFSFIFQDCCYMSTMYNLFAHSSLVQSCLS